MAQHIWIQARLAILLLAHTRLSPPAALVAILRPVGSVVSARAVGVGEHPGLEQCLRDGHYGACGDGDIVGAAVAVPDAEFPERGGGRAEKDGAEAACTVMKLRRIGIGYYAEDVLISRSARSTFLRERSYSFTFQCVV